MTRDFNTVVAHVNGREVPGRIEALEGGRGFMRVSLQNDGGEEIVTEGSELVLEMHDGVRFRVAVTEKLETSNEVRMKLLGRA